MALNKANKAIADHRRRNVAALRLRNYTEREIQQGLVELKIVNPRTGGPWSLGTIHNDLVTLDEQWLDAGRADVDLRKARENARLDEVMRVGFKEGNLTAVLSAIDKRIELYGLKAPTRTQIGGIPGADPIPVQSVSLLDGIDLDKLSDKELIELRAAVAAIDRVRGNRQEAGATPPG